jgi:hypothetical protein
MNDITEQAQIAHPVFIYRCNQVQWLETAEGIQKIGPVKALPTANLLHVIRLNIIHGISTTRKTTGSINLVQPPMPLKGFQQ